MSETQCEAAFVNLQKFNNIIRKLRLENIHRQIEGTRLRPLLNVAHAIIDKVVSCLITFSFTDIVISLSQLCRVDVVGQ
jgi:hypothetical protein